MDNKNQIRCERNWTDGYTTGLRHAIEQLQASLDRVNLMVEIGDLLEPASVSK